MTSAVFAPGNKPKMLAFRQRHGAVRFPIERAKRQGQITQIAFKQLHTRDRTLAFLNSPDAALGGRPLDIAIASEGGFALVERAIGHLAANQVEDRP